MSSRFIAGSTGAVALPSGLGMTVDVASFEVEESQAAESVASYGSAVYDPYLGSGTPHQAVTIGGFTMAGVTGDTAGPGFGTATVSSAGGSATLTYASGCTLAGSYLVQNLRTSHRRIGASCPVTAALHNTGDITTTWAVT